MRRLRVVFALALAGSLTVACSSPTSSGTEEEGEKAPSDEHPDTSLRVAPPGPAPNVVIV